MMQLRAKIHTPNVVKSFYVIGRQPKIFIFERLFPCIIITIISLSSLLQCHQNLQYEIEFKRWCILAVKIFKAYP
jgi:hypothetical protein